MSIRRTPVAQLRIPLALALGISILAPGCARPLPGGRLDAVRLAAPTTGAPHGPLTYEAALLEVVRSSPDLQALRHAIDGAGGWPSAAPLGLSIGADSDDRPELGASIDLLSLFGLGPWRAERVLAALRRSEATLALGARARELAGELTEAYAVAAALTEPAPEVRWVDPQAFVKAGLATPAATSAVEAARLGLANQVALIEAEREQARLRVGRILGLTPEAPVVLSLPGAGWPQVPEPDVARVLATHPDVQRRIGAYEVARGELLRAQADRDPGLELDPTLALDPTHFFGAVTLRLPVGAGPAIRAAQARMEAARLAVRAEVLRALEQASAARVAWQSAEGSLAAARARLAASISLADAQRAQVEAEGEGFTEALLAVHDVVGSLAEVRQAALDAARARARAASSAGWPLPALTPGPVLAPCPPPGAVPTTLPTRPPVPASPLAPTNGR